MKNLILNVTLMVCVVQLYAQKELIFTDQPMYKSIVLNEPVDLKMQIASFINMVNKDNNNDKRILYVIRGYEYDSVKHNYCFSMGYIHNVVEYPKISPSHYFFVGENIVVVWSSCRFNMGIFKSCELKLINSKDIDKLMGYLYPSVDGKMSVIYDPPGLTYCKKGEVIEKTYFLSADDIPINKFIYRYFNLNYTNELVRDRKMDFIK